MWLASFHGEMVVTSGYLARNASNILRYCAAVGLWQGERGQSSPVEWLNEISGLTPASRAAVSHSSSCWAS
jgi:hypothetical protein